MPRTHLPCPQPGGEVGQTGSEGDLGVSGLLVPQVGLLLVHVEDGRGTDDRLDLVVVMNSASVLQCFGASVLQCSGASVVADSGPLTPSNQLSSKGPGRKSTGYAQIRAGESGRQRM
jgi:hypothetical protein